jgi:hypothetical protein
MGSSSSAQRLPSCMSSTGMMLLDWFWFVFPALAIPGNGCALP